jgi:hypothetical protein
MKNIYVSQFAPVLVFKQMKARRRSGGGFQRPTAPAQKRRKSLLKIEGNLSQDWENIWERRVNAEMLGTNVAYGLLEKLLKQQANMTPARYTITGLNSQAMVGEQFRFTP